MLSVPEVKDFMIRDVVAVAPSTPVMEVAKLMDAHKIGSVVVAEDGCPVGIITERDMVHRVVARDGFDIEAAQAMSSPLITVNKDVDMAVAEQVMLENGISRVVVLDGERMVGIVTDKDVARTCPTSLHVSINSYKKMWYYLAGSIPSRAVGAVFTIIGLFLIISSGGMAVGVPLTIVGSLMLLPEIGIFILGGSLIVLLILFAV